MQNQRMTFVFAFLVFSFCFPTLGKGGKQIFEDPEEPSQNQIQSYTQNQQKLFSDEEEANKKRLKQKESVPRQGKKIKRQPIKSQRQRKKHTGFGVIPTHGLSDADTAHLLLLVTPQQLPAPSVTDDWKETVNLLMKYNTFFSNYSRFWIG